MEEVYRALLELQALDGEIVDAHARVSAYDPRIEELEAPIESWRREVDAVRANLAVMKQDVERLERGEREKKERLTRYQERLAQIRSARDEAAIRTEIDLVRRAAEADRHDIKQLGEQITRTELKLVEMEKDLSKAEEEMAPQRAALVAEREEAASELAVLEDKRENHALRIDQSMLRLYERVRSGRTRSVLAALTGDGACGHCFNVIPIQERAVIQRTKTLVRCEACGVILYPVD